MRLAILLFCLGITPASALPDDPYHLTEIERSACTEDAMRLCSSTYPDPHSLLVCMKANRASLSAVCQPIFDAGLKKRHL